MKRKIKKKEPKSNLSTEELAKIQYVNPHRLANSRRKKLVANITPSEKYIQGILDILKVEYKFQHIQFINRSRFYLLDFYFPKLNLCLELDGKHHQYDKDQIAHDIDRDAHTLSKGIKTIRLTNAQAMNLSLENIKTILEITNIII
jgi:very-short-patch-repair endonuclease